MFEALVFLGKYFGGGRGGQEVGERHSLTAVVVGMRKAMVVGGT